MSRMVSRSLSVADLCLIEVGGADSFLRFAVAIPDILSRRAKSTQVTDVLLLLCLSFSIVWRVFQVSLRDTVAPWLTHPASELAGYFQWSLRDLLRRYARTLQSNPLLTVARNAGPGGTSDNSPAFPTPGRRAHTAPRPGGTLETAPRIYPHTYCGSYSTLCFFKNATNSSSKLRFR